MTFLSCNEIAWNLLSQAEKARKLNSDGELDEEEGSLLVETIIYEISKDKLTEKIRQEHYILTEDQNCVVRRKDQLTDSVKKRKGAAVRYIKHTAGVNYSTSRQFTAIITRNFHPTADVANDVSLKLVMLS